MLFTLLKFAPAFVLGRLHHVETAVLLHQLLPLPGLDQAVDHGSQRIPVHTEAPPTATLHETGALLPAADEKRADLIEQHKRKPTKKQLLRLVCLYAIFIFYCNLKPLICSFNIVTFGSYFF